MARELLDGVRAVVDESVSPTALRRFKAFAFGKALKITSYFLVARYRPGMPDGQILHHVMDARSVLITCDRSFHNLALLQGYRSFFVGRRRVVSCSLPGLDISRQVAASQRDPAVAFQYIPDGADILPVLRGNWPRWKQRLRKKRNRIRSGHGGLAHIDSVSMTVSLLTCGKRTLLGSLLNVVPSIGLPPMPQSISVLSERVDVEDRALAALIHGLILPMLLRLDTLKVRVYFDPVQISVPVSSNASPPTPCEGFYRGLADSYRQLEILPADEGPDLMKLRRTLAGCASKPDHEGLPSGRLAEMLARFVKWRDGGADALRPAKIPVEPLSEPHEP